MSSWTQGLRPTLDGRHFDVVVVGGGINGVAIARESARAGKSTMLLEKNDFGAGTTSRSSRIIHGGLRYLEHGEIGLVRESLQERERLLRAHPHLVRRRRFVLAIRNGSGLRSALAIRAGLWLYGRFAGTKYDRNTSSDFERALQSGNAVACFNYEDAQCEFPERLLAEWLTAGIRTGAEVRNHTEVLELVIANGRVCGVRSRDLLSDKESTVSCDTVINATGPWADRFCAQAGVFTSKRMIGGVRGSHVVLPIFPGAPTNPVYSEAEDGRPIFLLPWNGQLLLGTTEVVDDGDPAQAAPSQMEVEYLFHALDRLVPNNGLSIADARYAFAGVRPLPYAPGEKPSKISRKHRVIEHTDDGARGMYSVVGGKLTTAARLARDCVRSIGVKVNEPATDLCAAPSSDGICSALQQWARQASRTSGVSEETAFAVAEWHGADALSVTKLAAFDPVWRSRICAHTPHILAEVAKTVRYERATTLGDILLRRLPVALGACWSAECSEEAAQKIGYALGWTRSRIEDEVEEFEQERSEFLHPRGRARTSELSLRDSRR